MSCALCGVWRGHTRFFIKLPWVSVSVSRRSRSRPAPGSPACRPPSSVCGVRPSCALRRAPHPHPAHPRASPHSRQSKQSTPHPHPQPHRGARSSSAWSVERGAMHSAVNAASCALRRAPHPHPAHPRQSTVHSPQSTVHTHTHTHTAARARARERRGPAHRTRYLAYCPHPRAQFGASCVCSLCVR